MVSYSGVSGLAFPLLYFH